MTTLASRTQALIDGNERFVSAAPQHCHDVTAQRRAAAEAHDPTAAVLACADARVAPELVFDQGVGELFSVRVAGNVPARAAVASLEFAVTELGVELVVVLGHEQCGAVTAAVEHVTEGTELPGELAALVDRIVPAVTATAGLPGDHVHHAIVANTSDTVEQLRRWPGPLSAAVAAGRLEIVGAVYDLDTGRVRFLRPVPPEASPEP
jgi:carbonic anhydrase